MPKKRRKGIVIFAIAFWTLFLSLVAFVGFRYYPDVKKTFINKTEELSFVLNRIEISGLENINKEKLEKQLPLKMGGALLDIDIKRVEDVIYKDSWVNVAHIYLEYPDTINISIEEKLPKAIAMVDGTLVIVDVYGNVLSKKLLEKYENLPVILAEKDEIYNIIQYMKSQPDFYDIWKKAEFINGRRWNIYIGENIKVMLPEDSVIEALERLNELKINGKLLSYKINKVDLRFPGKAIIK